MSDDRMSEKWIEHWVKTNPDRDRARAVGMVFPGDPGYVEPPKPPTAPTPEEAFLAGYHCRWHADLGMYSFDPELTPGDPEGAYAAWVAHRGAHGR